MAALIDGILHDIWYDTHANNGEFVREAGACRGWVRARGKCGLRAAPGRYHLYAGYGDSWSHRALLARSLKGLHAAVPLCIVDPVAGPQGWDCDAASRALDGYDHLYELYLATDPQYSGWVTVPLLWDSVQRRVVSNDSGDIMRMLLTEFDAYATVATDLYPAPLRAEIDALNAYLYEHVNDGVYRAAFATGQHAYQVAVRALFGALDELDRRLRTRRYLLGACVTESDWRLFTNLVRFDTIYHGYFKCDLRRLQDYENLWPYTRELFQMPGVAETVNFEHMRRTYYHLGPLNPSGTVPERPPIEFTAPVLTLRYRSYTAPLLMAS